MYEEYYGFVQPPFSLTPDPRFLYRSESHEIALQQVWQAIRRKEGFIVLTGDIGTGKTTLCRTLLEQFDATTFTALILNPFLSVEELLRELLLSFGIVSREALRSGRLAAASKHELVRTLHDFLLSLVPLQGSAVLIIDEAQHLSSDVLEEIRVLSNLETPEQKLLQIVLVGQLNLLDLLHQQNMRQLDQRISLRCTLRPLTREEVEAYITHRLFVARGSTPIVFTPTAVGLVHALSGGVPRMINLVCDRALMVGRETETGRITEAEVARAAQVLGLAVPHALEGRGPRRRAAARAWRTAAAAGATLLLTTAAAGLYLFGDPLESTTALEPPAPPSTVPLPLPSGLPIPHVPAAVPELAPAAPGGVTLLLGRFHEADAAAQLAARLLARDLPVYLIDVRLAPDQIERRVFVGRFTSRAQALAVRAELAGEFPGAQVLGAALERIRELPQ